MSITIVTLTTAGNFRVHLPDASAIPVPSVAKAVVALKEMEGELAACQRERDVARLGVKAAQDAIAAQAAELKIKKKHLGREILAPLREAEEAAEFSQIALDATMRAFEAGYAQLVAEVNANRRALEAAALKDAHAALQRLAVAKEAWGSAAHAASASYGLLGMFFENDRTGAGKLQMRDRSGSNRELFTQEATTAIDRALGRNALELEAHKRGDAPSKKELEAADDGED